MARYFFDTESDGFVKDLTRLHCLVLQDVNTGEVFSFGAGRGDDITEGVKMLMHADEAIAHNAIKHDIPAIQKVYPWFSIDRDKVTDTLVLAKLYQGSIKEEDLAKRPGTYPKQLFGQQSLEAWGYRLGDYKGDYKGPWDAWSEEMQEYCIRDVEVLAKLYQHLRKFGPWPRAERLEHEAAWLCAQIERNGIRFNVEKAYKLYGELAEMREKLANELKALFDPWWASTGLTKWGRTARVWVPDERGAHLRTYRKGKEKKLTTERGWYNTTDKDSEYTSVAFREFNPRSRDHIANRLKAKYGWEPEEFTNSGKPQIDDRILEDMSYPEAKKLASLFLTQKRIDQLAEGDEAWIKREKNGWIFHSINPNGANTGRATHSRINITQVPRVGSWMGAECRELFEVPAGWRLLGTDASSLEMRCLANYMSPHDNGVYARAVVSGSEDEGTDPHSINARALGLEPQRIYAINGKQIKGRNAAKNWFYAFMYGGGDKKLGKMLGKGPAAGKRLKDSFLRNTPALKSLREAVVATTKKRSWLRGLDGRQIHIRSEHSALNALLQSAGAIICKKWIVETERLLCEKGLKHGWDGDFAFLMWCHDEIEVACRDGLDPELVGATAKEAMQLTAEFFGFRCPLDCAFKVGMTWRDVH